MPKKKQSVVEAMDEIESQVKLLCDQANNQMKVREYEKALTRYDQALDLNPNDANALVARSKCYLLLGEPAKALEDAETALSVDKTNIRAIYQKAEALYYLGQFEQSLMFFHCGLRARPELTIFRLGVQKTQEAIENTIGVVKKGVLTKSKQQKKNSNSTKQTPVETPKSTKTTARSKKNVDHEKRNARKLLGELCVDKEYLENLLKHPDLKRADTNTESISTFAREAVDFLNKRQEFWRQQRPCTAMVNHRNTNPENIPPWF
ncbi:outer dynein arm-docking complex subunit 4 [Condylostylus longicornis]|uniref:outer dynein arm-docking complex subunit 4 n=1 Tax=Condylostylus longicornis TaxID=2530218 RepID=UPI00244DA13E|nr:outer dynein arm-docking complex subunit 4 [Condylostylus longicornis]XP_055372675.1 outer dynein arm-docking complex subunit 4 [Condylostylus longicornis]